MSVSGKEYKLAIRIAGIIDKSFNASLSSSKAALAGYKATVDTLDKDFTKLDKGFNKIMGAGKKSFKAVTTAATVAAAAVGAVTVASAAVGSSFESAFTGVKKTVDATDAEYAKLRRNILDMSRDIPSSDDEIAGVMEIAGQLGIATNSLSDFTKTMINLGVSTNMAADEAATNLARFANVTGMADYGPDGVSNYERLGSVITDLGNKFATTESEITEMGTRLASTGHLVGLSQAQIMALATAMSSVGIKAESGGSTMAKLLKKMQLAVETNSDALGQYASVANMTGEQFKQTFKTDAVSALGAFIGGLNDTERNGKSAIAILDDMKLSEVRLSNTILALAGSGDLMTRAINTANTAWNENTALATEAGKRYETVKSKAKMLGNAFEELGITAYDDLREPLVDCMGSITDEVHNLNDYVGSANGVKKWISGISEELPTLERKAGNAWSTVEPLFSGLMGAGKWFLKNPQVIAGGLTTIGTALATYKTASTVTHVLAAINKFAALSGLTKGILGVGAAFSTLMGIIVACEAKFDQVAEDNLDEHFGDIALSMKELQNVAEQIVGAKDLEKVQQTLSEMEKVEGFSDSMQEALADISKLNWKVSVGMELTTDDQESYKQAINEYVQAAQDYAVQQQYAVSLEMGLGFDYSDPVQANIVDKVNAFYAGASSEMTSLGQDLSQAVNDAFADGILDPNEVGNIAQIQEKIAKLKAEIATDQLNANLEATTLKYSGAELDADSFRNLQKEIGSSVDDYTDTKLKEYTASLTALENTYNNGGMSTSEFNIGKQNLKANYYQDVGDAVGRAATYQLNTIVGQYSPDMGQAFKGSVKKDNLDYLKRQLSLSKSDVKEIINQSGYDTISDEFSSIAKNLLNDSDFSVVRKSMSKLLTEAQPTIEDMQKIKEQCEAAGEEVPDSVAKGLKNFDMLQGVVSGNMDSLYEAIGMSLSGTEYADVIQQLAKQGRDIPQALLDGINEGAAGAGTDSVAGMLYSIIAGGTEKGAANAAANSIYNSAYSAVPEAVNWAYSNANTLLGQKFAQGFTAKSNVNVTLTPTYTLTAGNAGSLTIPKDSQNAIFSGIKASVGGGTGLKALGLKHNANGGIWDHPIITTFAEEGKEAAIPINGTQRAVDLWRQTGHLLGMDAEMYNISEAIDKSVVNNAAKHVYTAANSSTYNISNSQISDIKYNNSNTGYSSSGDNLSAVSNTAYSLQKMVSEIPVIQTVYNYLNNLPEQISQMSPTADTASYGSENTVNSIVSPTVSNTVSKVYSYLSNMPKSIKQTDVDIVNSGYNVPDVKIENPTRQSSQATLARNLTGLKGMGVKANANGGIWDSPILTTFAEHGREAAIPIDGSQNAINLWEQTGHLLGMDSRLDGVSFEAGHSSEPTTIEYKPVLNFYGAAPSKDDLTDALDISQEKFERMMRQYEKNKGRVSY